MTAWAKERVEYLPLWLDAITVGTKAFFFVVVLYLAAATAGAFFIGQGEIAALWGTPLSAELLMWCERLTGWFSIGLFFAFVNLTNASGNNKRREKITDAIVMALGFLVPQAGYHIGYALKYVEVANNPMIAQLAFSPVLAYTIALFALTMAYVLTRSHKPVK